MGGRLWFPGRWSERLLHPCPVFRYCQNAAVRDRLSCAYLCAEEFRWRVNIGVVRGDVNIAVHVVLCYCFNDARCTFDMYIFKVKVPEVIVQSSFLKTWRVFFIHTWSCNPVRQGYKLHQNALHSPRSIECFVNRIPGRSLCQGGIVQICRNFVLRGRQLCPNLQILSSDAWLAHHGKVPQQCIQLVL